MERVREYRRNTSCGRIGVLIFRLLMSNNADSDSFELFDFFLSKRLMTTGNSRVGNNGSM